MSSEVERWKNKYFTKLEEVEQTEKRLNDHLHLLERVVVRVSLAAEGVDSQLDKELGSLRALLRREDHSVRELGQQLEQIEKRVLALDENKAGVPEKVMAGLDELIRLLSDAVESRELRKQLKQLGKGLKDRVQEIREYPVILSEFGKILQDALAELSSGEAPRKEGFFARLFGGRDAQAPVAAGAESAESGDRTSPSKARVESGDAHEQDQEQEQEGERRAHDEKTQDESLGDPYQLESGAGAASGESSPGAPKPTDGEPVNGSASINELPTSVSPVSTSDNGSGEDRGSTPDLEPGYSRVADRIHGILSNLLEQLALPGNMEKPREQLKAKLGAKLNWYELVPTLDDVAILVIAAVGRGQQEFELFLKALDDRLAGLQAFLEFSQNSHQASRVNNAELEQRMREQVSDMQTHVRTADSLESLKHSVENNLNTIIHSLDDFLRKEAARESDLSEEMEQLKDKLRTLEEESGTIKARLQEEAQRSMTDVLTGLPNRVAYNKRADEEFARWQRYGRPLTLVVADIDFFKRINDSYGHLAGDRVLQLIGKEVASRIRTTDFLARYGGEEMVILMPETAAQVAMQVMDKTREMVSRLPFHFRNEKVQITMSFGISEFQGQDTIEGVFERADRALYRAKGSGRNQVQIELPA